MLRNEIQYVYIVCMQIKGKQLKQNIIYRKITFKVIYSFYTEFIPQLFKRHKNLRVLIMQILDTDHERYGV